MIKEEERYFSLTGDVQPGGPSTWHIIDWDQRRTVAVTMDGEQEDESEAIKHFRRHSNDLPLEVYRVHLSDNGELLSRYTDTEDDHNYCAHYPRLDEVSLPDGIQTIRRDELRELDRFGPAVDLVTYRPCPTGASKKVVFKYYFISQYAPRVWNEMNLLMRLPKHPHIVPFDRVVLDELEGRVIGFTCKFIPGGTLWENGSRIFKLKWLQQLTHVVDDLNLRFGISHQDVAPRNILVDDTTDSIKIFDFNFSARIKPLLSSPPNEKEKYREDRNDVKGVIFTLYEIITRDDSFRSMDHRKQNVNDLRPEWDKHPDVQLDSPVATYRQLLEDWRRTREAIVDGQPDAGPGRAPQAFDWPTRPQPPRKSLPVLDWEMKPSTMVVDQWFESRQEVRDRGGKVLNWERPPQETLAEGDCLLSTGERMKC